MKDLEEKEILISNEKLSKKLGNPFILVLPSVKKGLSPIRALSADKYLKHSATVIESYLTSRNFDVVVSNKLKSLRTSAMLSYPLVIKVRILLTNLLYLLEAISTFNFQENLKMAAMELINIRLQFEFLKLQQVDYWVQKRAIANHENQKKCSILKRP